MTGDRLDVELVRRGLARSRAQAREAIDSGRVRVDGAVASRPSARIGPASELEVDDPDPWVARSAHKLVAALDDFGIPVAGRTCLDVGASTGGFTQVLLARGAREVIALDVGRDQLVRELRANPRVRVVEGANARDLDPERLREWSGTDARPELVVVDVSFIPLGLVLPAIRTVALDDVVALIKPQFEVGRSTVRDGLVRDPGARRAAVTSVLDAAAGAGWGIRGVIPSPIPGSTGNREYLVHLTVASDGDPTEWDGPESRERRIAALP